MADLAISHVAPRAAESWELGAWPRAVVAWLGSLRHLSLLAVLSLTAHAHWALAVQVLDFPALLGWTLPLAVDCYVLSALRAWEAAPTRRHGDLWWALGLDGVAVAGSHAATQLEVAAPVRAGVAALLGVVLVLVLWRVHALDVEVRRAPRRAPSRPADPPPPPPAPPAHDSERASGQRRAPEQRRRATVDGGDVVAELVARRAAGVSRAAATAEVVEVTGRSLRTVQRRAGEVWGEAA